LQKATTRAIRATPPFTILARPGFARKVEPARLHWCAENREIASSAHETRHSERL
jgi:hypothetical protein